MYTDRATTADFFAMFGVPFLYGSAWSAQDDASHAQVVVLSRAMNQKLFGGGNSVGENLVIAT
jgi:putative ABC transport system permease protein